MARDDDFLGMETIDIEGLDDLMDYDEDDDLDGGYEDDYDEGDEYDDSEEDETEKEEETSGRGSSELAALKAQISTLTQIIASGGVGGGTMKVKGADPPDEDERYDVSKRSESILKKFKEALNELAEDNRLTPAQARGFSAQIGENLVPELLTAIEEDFGKRTRELDKSYKSLLKTFSTAERKRAANRFFENHPEANSQSVINALNSDLSKDPVWQDLLRNPDEEDMHKHLERVYAPYASEAQKNAKRAKAKKDKLELHKRRKNTSEISEIGREESGGDATQKRGLSVRQTLESELKRELSKQRNRRRR